MNFGVATVIGGRLCAACNGEMVTGDRMFINDGGQGFHPDCATGNNGKEQAVACWDDDDLIDALARELMRMQQLPGWRNNSPLEELLRRFTDRTDRLAQAAERLAEAEAALVRAGVQV